MGLDPDAYRCEPCGHRFGRDGKEIADARLTETNGGNR